MSDSIANQSNAPTRGADSLAVAAVVTSLAACYMDLVQELADAGHIDRQKLAARLERTAQALTRDADSAGANLTRLIAMGVAADINKPGDADG